MAGGARTNSAAKAKGRTLDSSAMPIVMSATTTRLDRIRLLRSGSFPPATAPLRRGRKAGHGCTQYSAGGASRLRANLKISAANILEKHTVDAKAECALPTLVKAHIEPEFGASFDSACVYRDTRAADCANTIGANASKRLNQIAFDQSTIAPGTDVGDRPNANKPAHVVVVLHRFGKRSELDLWGEAIATEDTNRIQVITEADDRELETDSDETATTAVRDIPQAGDKAEASRAITQDRATSTFEQ